MSLLDLLSDKEVWQKFYNYKASLASSSKTVKELSSFIAEKRYLPVCELIASGGKFPLPVKSVISKTGTDKKRTVYTYPDNENMVLKLLTYLLLRKYDCELSGNLYSFRPKVTAKDAVRSLTRHESISEMYSYKADIHDYFNSADISLLLPVLSETIKKHGEDDRLFSFLKKLLIEPKVIERGRIISEKKGIMAGTPLSSFYANIYLSSLDHEFEDDNIIYARYSDDIIVFAGSKEELLNHVNKIKTTFSLMNLEINHKKEYYSNPGESFTFLGFSVDGKKIDIAPVTLEKLKGKMRRKRDALSRWKKRNDIDGEKAAKAFIRIFNRKLFESPDDNELSWSMWFFPLINTTESLHIIDIYAQDCIRYLIYGRHTKGRYSVKYSDLKRLGFRSLLNEYYKSKKILGKEPFRPIMTQ